MVFVCHVTYASGHVITFAGQLGDGAVDVDLLATAENDPCALPRQTLSNGVADPETMRQCGYMF